MTAPGTWYLYLFPLLNYKHCKFGISKVPFDRAATIEQHFGKELGLIDTEKMCALKGPPDLIKLLESIIKQYLTELGFNLIAPVDAPGKTEFFSFKGFLAAKAFLRSMEHFPACIFLDDLSANKISGGELRRRRKEICDNESRKAAAECEHDFKKFTQAWYQLERWVIHIEDQRGKPYSNMGMHYEVTWDNSKQLLNDEAWASLFKDLIATGTFRSFSRDARIFDCSLNVDDQIIKGTITATLETMQVQRLSPYLEAIRDMVEKCRKR